MSFKWLAALFLAGSVAFAAAPASADGPAISIVALGDSLMAGYQLPKGQSFPAVLQKKLRAKGYSVTVTNAGVSGDTSADGLARLDWSVPDGTNAVILELGANDALRGITPTATEENLGKIISRLKKRGIAVLLAGMLAPPNMGTDYTKTFDAIFPRLAKKYDLVFYPFFLDGVATKTPLLLSDGMHPNANGVTTMVDAFLPTAEKLLHRLRGDG